MLNTTLSKFEDERQHPMTVVSCLGWHSTCRLQDTCGPRTSKASRLALRSAGTCRRPVSRARRWDILFAERSFFHWEVSLDINFSWEHQHKKRGVHPAVLVSFRSCFSVWYESCFSINSEHDRRVSVNLNEPLHLGVGSLYFNRETTNQ